jgi:1-acyl-sn-glycerol-3-phosphate acyltransferase
MQVVESGRSLTARVANPVGVGNAVLSSWTWFVFGSSLIVCFFLQVLLAPLTWPFDRRRVITGRLIRLTAVVTTALTPVWRFRVVLPTPRPRPRRTVVIANHRSSADPFLLSHLPWEMKWLSKASMFKIPFGGWCMALAGDVAVLRGDRGSGGKALGQLARWLDKGMPVMIFPEGTRSGDGALGEFKDGAFRLALETGADLLPMGTVGTDKAIRKHSWRIAAARAVVKVGEPISTAGLGMDDLEALKARARAAVEQLVREAAAEAER